MGDRVAVMKDGPLQQVDTPRRLYDHPANLFVAGFIGSPAMNLIEVPLTDAGVQVGGSVVPVERDIVATAGQLGLRSVILGFRPEDTVMGDGEAGVPIVVDVVESLGADAYVCGRVTTQTGEEQVVVRADGRFRRRSATP